MMIPGKTVLTFWSLVLSSLGKNNQVDKENHTHTLGPQMSNEISKYL